jgi:hypothetical protein
VRVIVPHHFTRLRVQEIRKAGKGGQNAFIAVD